MINPFTGLFKSRDKPQNRVGGGWDFMFGGSSSGRIVNERTAMQTSAVYACVKLIAESIAALPLHVYRETADKSKEKATDHPLYYLLHSEPNPEMTSFVFRETIMTHLLLWGNAYVQIIRDGRGQVTALYPLLPHLMEVEREKGGKLLYTYTTDSGTTKLRRENLVHVVGQGFDGLIGYSPIAMNKNAIGMAIAAEEFGAKFFANGGTPIGILETPKVINEKGRDKLKSDWSMNYGGDKAHKLAVLEEGAKFTPISIPPNQAQFLETRKFQLNEIARIFKVPPHMIADLERSTNNNIENQSLEFIKYTLNPWIVNLEQAFKQSLVPLNEKQTIFIMFNLNGLERGDFKSRNESYRIAINNGYMSPNEAREKEDLNLIPDEVGGNKFLVNGTMTELKDVGAAYRTNEAEKSE